MPELPKKNNTWVVGAAGIILTALGMLIAAVIYVTSPLACHDVRLNEVEAGLKRHEEELKEQREAIHRIDKGVEVLLERTRNTGVTNN